jgi:hypothetical protein
MRPKLRLILAALTCLMLLASAGCNEDVPNFTAASVEELTTRPTASTVQGAVIGMFAVLRGTAVGVEGQAMCALAKECYFLSTLVTTPQYITGPISPGSAIASQLQLGWTSSYQNIRQGAIVLEAVDRVSDYTDAQREGIRGVVKTLIAMELFLQIRIRDTVGIPVMYSADPAAPLAPIVGKDEALARIAGLLDESKTHLLAAGGAFVTPLLHTGFTRSGTFNSPATFLQFNRGLKARVEIHRRRWPEALAAINESFIDVSSGSATTLAKGVYHVFSTGSGDATNGLFDAAPASLYAHPTIVTGAQVRANGQPDLRVTQKTAPGVARSLYGVSAQFKFTIYASNTSPVPIIRNEELILMRAEARFHSGDVAGALADINFIRVNSGGLVPLPSFDSAEAFVDELLYNRTYSLLLERGNRWTDARRYGRLDRLPKVNTAIGERTFPYVMFPQAECDQRSPKPQPGCSAVPGM